MKKSFTLKPLALSLAVASASTVAIVPAVAQAGVSANVGVFSDYIFRGLNQHADTSSPAIQGGLDYESDIGLFAGVWASSVEIGYEYDLYAGYAGSVGDFDFGIAYTNYSYTHKAYADPKGGTFEEINLSAGYGPIGIGYDLGDDDIVEENYTHASISVDLGFAVDGLGVTYGLVDYDNDDGKYDYTDIGYGTSFEGVDISVNYILQGNDTGGDNFFVVGASKSFDLM